MADDDVSTPAAGPGEPGQQAQRDQPGQQGQAGSTAHGRHRGDPADAPRRATRPATNAPAHRAEPAARGAAPDAPVLPASKDDLDVGWGGSAGPDDDDRILREVPPHWQ